MKLNVDDGLHNADWLKTLNADFPNGITLAAAQDAEDKKLPVTLAPNWHETAIVEKFNPYHDEVGRFTEADNDVSGMAPSSGGGGSAPVALPEAAGGTKPLTPRQQAAAARSKAEAVAYMAARGWTPEVLEANARAIFERAKENGETYQKGLVWYQNQHDEAIALGQKYGYTPEQSIGAIAALSPKCEWERNLVVAENAMRILETPTFTMTRLDADDYYARGLERINKELADNPKYEYADSKARLEANYERAKELVGVHRTADVSSADLGKFAGVGAMSGPSTTAIAILRGERDTNPNGAKTGPFYDNILRPDSSENITLDTHMIRAIVNDSRLPEADTKLAVNTDARHELLAAPIKAIAAQEGLSAKQVQAIIWEQQKVEHPRTEQRLTTLSENRRKKALGDTVTNDGDSIVTYTDFYLDLVWQGFSDAEIAEAASHMELDDSKSKDWNEEDHPRDDSGRFTDSVSASTGGRDYTPEAAVAFHDANADWVKTLTKDQQESVTSYAGFGYRGINLIMRDPAEAEKQGFTHPAYHDDIATIKEVIANGPVFEEDTVLWRALSLESDQAVEDLGKNGEFTDPAFQSTMLGQEDYAKAYAIMDAGHHEMTKNDKYEFNRYPYRASVLARITVPAGTHYADVQAIRTLNNTGAHESEILLGPARYTVDSLQMNASVEKYDSGKRIYDIPLARVSLTYHPLEAN